MSSEARPKRILIAWYSRTGATRTVGRKLAELLGGGIEVEEVADTRKRSGPIGFLGAGRDAMRRTLVPIAPPRLDPAGFDLLIVGTPIWAGTMAAAVRTFLTNHCRGVAKAGFFYTASLVKYQKVFAEMAALCSLAAPAATLELSTREVRKDRCAEKLAAFVEALRQCPSA